MQCHFSFSVDVESDMAAVFRHVARAIGDGRGRLTGNTRSGRFITGGALRSIHGRYTVRGNTVNIVICRRPLGIGCRRIEARIREYFRQMATSEE